MIGIGAMIGAGIFVLTGIAAGEAGPASILAFALNGAVTLLTAFAYAELASAIPRAGGGYSFVRMAFPGVAGFVAGWMLWFAYIVACSLYALGFASYFWEFFEKYLPNFSGGVFGILGEHSAILMVTLFIGVAFVWLNDRGAAVTGKAENALTLAKIAVLGIFIFFGLKVILHEPGRVVEGFTPFFPAGFGGVLVAMGLTFIAFEGYDLIATVAEEIKSPEKNIPRATFISLGVTVFMYLLILFVSLGAIDAAGEPSWEFLGRYKETAIVRAAEGFMPAVGVAIIVIGGLLSTMSALNATVMAASRVAFSMGRDLWLPKRMSEIDPKRRTPRVAIFVTGGILLVMAVPRRYRMPLYPVLPVLGFSLNIFLAVYQFNFQPIAWVLTAGWVGFGLLLYYAIFEKKAAHLEPQVLLPGRLSREPDQEPSVVVALHNPDNVETLLRFAYPVAQQRGVRLIAVTVVEVPRQMPIHEGIRFTHHKEPLLDAARKFAAEQRLELETDLVVAHVASDGILSAVGQHRAEALVMGWKGYTNARDRVFGEIADRIIRLAPCDLMLLKLSGERLFRHCLLPTAGGPNAKLAATILGDVAKAFNMDITGAHVVPKGASVEQREKARKRIDETLARIDQPIRLQGKLIESDSVAGGIAKASREFDLVVIGAALEPFFRKMLFGEIPEKVASFSPTSVLVVKKYEGPVKSLVKRIMG